MGSYDVSCSLTGTAIYPGDPCVFVILRKGFDFAQDTLSPRADYSVEAVIKTSYDDYGFPHGTEEFPDSYVHGVVDGLWGSRGDTEKGRLHFFVCQQAWTWCQEPGHLPMLNPGFLRTLDQKHLEVSRVFLAFHCAHRNILSGFNATGQWEWPDDFDSVEANANLTIECCKSARARRLVEQEKEWDK